jgi:hypothetical protein
MKPYQTIEDQKTVINDLTYKLQFSKEKVKDAKTINTLINTVNCFETMLKNKYFTDVIETLLYANIKEWLMQSEVYDGSPIPLQEMCSGVEFDIANGSKQKKLEVLSVLKSHELENMIKNDTLKNANFTDFNKLLTDLINEFKKSIVWNK